MEIYDLQGGSPVATDTELLTRLRTTRQGNCGAFTLYHQDGGPSLHIHINQDFAYVHYFDDATGSNAGYQPTGMTPIGCPKSVHFVQTDGSESYAFEMTHAAICSPDAAYDAAVEFLHNPGLPKCIKWLAL
jgi:hypothetical protein